MLKNFFSSYWFNVVLAVITAFFVIMQEVWTGGFIVPLFAIIIYAILSSFFASSCVELLKLMVFADKFNWKPVLIGTGAGSIVGIITILFAVL